MVLFITFLHFSLNLWTAPLSLIVITWQMLFFILSVPIWPEGPHLSVGWVDRWPRKAFSCLRAGDGKQAEELFASAVLATAAAPNVDAIYGMGVLKLCRGSVRGVGGGLFFGN
jgi:hypothetical protein